jgi:ADP-ribose pyrophosphatase YjhB (NUDIX family)
VHAPVRIRVGAVIQAGERVLVVRHEKDGRAYWLLPGGGVEPGETLEAALRRELLEECGLTAVSVTGPIAIAESIAPAGTPGGRHVVQILFDARVPRGALAFAVSGDDAVRNHRLVERAELSDLDLRPPIQRFLERYEHGDPFVALGRIWSA